MKILSKYNIDEALEYLEKELMRRKHQTESEIFWEDSKGEKIDISLNTGVDFENIVRLPKRQHLYGQGYVRPDFLGDVGQLQLQHERAGIRFLGFEVSICHEHDCRGAFCNEALEHATLVNPAFAHVQRDVLEFLIARQHVVINLSGLDGNDYP